MVNERSWDLMKAWYEGRGYRCQAPSWPERRAGLGLAELADHYEAIVRLEPGRPFFQTALAMMDRNSPCRIDFATQPRPPLLIIAGAADRTVAAAAVRANYQRYAAGGPTTEYVEFPRRTHWIIAQPGWEEVASRIDQFIRAQAS